MRADSGLQTWTVYCVLCTVYCVLRMEYGVLSTVLCTVYCVLCTVYCVLCTVYCVLCTAYCVLCAVYCVQCTVHCALDCAHTHNTKQKPTHTTRISAQTASTTTVEVAALIPQLAVLCMSRSAPSTRSDANSPTSSFFCFSSPYFACRIVLVLASSSLTRSSSETTVYCVLNTVLVYWCAGVLVYWCAVDCARCAVYCALCAEYCTGVLVCWWTGALVCLDCARCTVYFVKRNVGCGRQTVKLTVVVVGIVSHSTAA
jgi:hypothetical protein